MTNDVYLFIHAPMWTKARIRAKEAQIKDLELMMLPSGIRYDKDAVQTSPGDPMLEFAEKLTELEAEIIALKRQYLTEQRQVSETINKLPPDEAEVLTERYILGLKFEEIAESCHVVERTVYRWHRLGIRHLGEMLGSKDVSECQ